ncbi:MAG TPA: ABC transporter permease [Verrucomicrobiae bacterium]|nr:ABC transporter permease [Verrucomicrobiae bacterium]
MPGRIHSFFRNLLHKNAVEQELDDELQSAVELLTQEKMKQGFSRAEARRQTLIELGGVERVKEEVRAIRSGMFLEVFAQDLRYALRLLRKSPGFAIVAVLTLALGIGATTAIFSVLDGVVLEPLPYPHPKQLIGLELTPLGVNASLRGMAPEDYFIFREQGRTFQDLGIYVESDSDRDVNVTGFSEPERVHALHVTYGVLTALGIPPILGSGFSPANDAPGAAPTAILTYAYWQRKYSADPAAIGKTIIVDGVARQIIGVMPRNFQFLDTRNLALILPLQLDRSQTHLMDFSYSGIARLKPGITLEQARADVARLIPVTFASFPPPAGITIEGIEKIRLSPSLLPLKQEVIGNVSTMLWVLMGGIGIVLLIACANVANLLLVRTEGRQNELRVRTALGASRRRVALQLLNESVVLGVIGSACGLGLGWAALRLVAAHAPSDLPRAGNIGLNPPAVYFTLGIALISTLIFSLIPILKQTRTSSAVVEGSRTFGLTRERHRARNVLVTVQVALGFVLLICSGLMLRTFNKMTRVEPGFADPAGLQTFRISIPSSDVPDDAKVPRIEQQILEKLAAIPSVSSAALSTAVPMDGDTYLHPLNAEGHEPSVAGAPTPARHFVFVTPGYFQTMGIPLLAGRDITWADTFNEVPVALISENFAREYWGTPAAAVGKRIRVRDADDWREIIGVVGDVRDDGIDKPWPTDVYWPVLLQNFESQPMVVERFGTFVVRSPLAGAESLLGQIRRAVWSIDANLPLAGVYTMNHYYKGSMARASFTLVMLGIAGIMALILSAVGLYGVIAYSVSQRTREIGIRVALGAEPRHVLSLVLNEGMQVILAGLAIGLMASLLLTRFLASLLFGVSPTDPLTFAGVTFLLAVVALAACYIPARRAIRVDPMVALKYE